MSRKSLQMKKVAASGPLVEVQRNGACTVFVRGGKTVEQFAATLPRFMDPDKRARIIRRNFSKE